MRGQTEVKISDNAQGWQGELAAGAQRRAMVEEFVLGLEGSGGDPKGTKGKGQVTLKPGAGC